ncbi:hypothetical protein Tco_1498604, partial [Tanacetum coccineum]
DIVAEFCGPSRRKELSKETSSKILPCGDRSCWKTFKPTAGAFFPYLHHHGQRYHIVPFGEFNGVPVALVARFGVISESTERIRVSHGG